jgi:hypothetical protein
MEDRIQDHLASLRLSLNARLDELEQQISSIQLQVTAQLSANPSEDIPHASAVSSDSSPVVKDFTIDDFAAQYEENSEAALSALITEIRAQLSGRVHTKRLIEKSNSQYVDTSFQRVSTRMTALVNQKVMTRHYQLESELSSVIAAIDGLHDQVVHELADVRGLIQECRSIMEDLRGANEFAAHGNQRGRVSKQKGVLRKPIVPLLRARNSVQADAVQVSLSLSVTKPV